MVSFLGEPESRMVTQVLASRQSRLTQRREGAETQRGRSSLFHSGAIPTEGLKARAFKSLCASALRSCEPSGSLRLSGQVVPLRWLKKLKMSRASTVAVGALGLAAR